MEADDQKPISDYVQYEYDGTFTNIAAGEQVRWLPRRQTWDLALPGVDFWVFDEQTVIFNHFSGSGQWMQKGMEVTSEIRIARLCAAAFETVWDRAIPHAEYRPAA